MASAEEKLLKEFGKNLQKLRIEKGFSTRKFVNEADLSKSSLYRLEAGLTNPSLITLLKLADALQVDLNKLGMKK
jgi:transcriptional regulator with XRE-family HTH domain